MQPLVMLTRHKSLAPMQDDGMLSRTLPDHRRLEETQRLAGCALHRARADCSIAAQLLMQHTLCPSYETQKAMIVVLEAYGVILGVVLEAEDDLHHRWAQTAIAPTPPNPSQYECEKYSDGIILLRIEPVENVGGTGN